MSKLINIEKLAVNIQENIKTYCLELTELHGDNLKTIIAYGETLAKEINPKKAALNLLLIFDKVTVSTLKNSLDTIKKGRKKGIVAPLFLTTEHIKTSTDIFPIEFLEMKENHILLYGKDSLSDLEIKFDNIRLQCEQELKGKVIRLRQNYLEVGLARGSVENLILNSFTSFIPVFKNLLRLKNKNIPQELAEVIEVLAAEFNLNQQLFLSILNDKQRDEKIGGKDALAFFEDYLAELKKLSQIVDKM